MGNRENSIRVQNDFYSEQEVYHEIHIRGAAGHWPQDLQRRDQSLSGGRGIRDQRSYRKGLHEAVSQLQGTSAEKRREDGNEAVLFKAESAKLAELESMTKEELIREVMRARIREARLKKGYEVKGDGTVILYDIENTKS